MTLASRRGNGPPRRRCLGALRGVTPTLVLRQGPDSYGRQQCGILVNGRKSEPAMSRAGDGPTGLKLLLYGDNRRDVSRIEGTI